MNSEFLVDLMKKIRVLGFGPHTPDIKGCTTEEIEQIRQAQNVERLPEIYRQFLLYMGQGSGRLFASCDYTYGRLQSMKQELEHQIRVNHAQLLPPEAFVFLYDTADIYYWFCTNAGDDPPVFYHEDGHSDFVKIAESLTIFLTKSYEDAERLRRRMAS